MNTKRKKNTNKPFSKRKSNVREAQEPFKGERRSKSKIEVEGIVNLTREGFGFVSVPDSEDDIFIPFRKLRGALNGDRVKVAVSKHQKGNRRTEGEIIYIIERSKRPHIGVLHIRGNQVWAIVESKNMPYDIRIPVESLDELPTIGGQKAENGMKVAVIVTEWPHKSVEPLGKIVDVLGKPGDNDTEMHAILAEFALPYRFEKEVEDAANKISEKIEPAEIQRRRDFRGTTTFTIDPTDAKDFDDALSIKYLDNGNFEVGIHIADVSFYVTSGCIVDKEAYNRATSVYLVDRTVPMLPENLSNKLCSLRPHEDKLCFSAVFEMDAKAKVINSWFGRTVINSDYRFDYEQAQDIIVSMKGPLCKEILKLNELASILRKKRFEHGAINFERPEMKVKIDETGKPIDVYQKETKESNWLIEEFMLLANRQVAEFVTRKCGLKNPTFVYRIHENPNPEKIEGLRAFAKNFGYTLGSTDNPKSISKTLNDLMSNSKGKPEEGALEMLALRSMARARYSTDNVGHYGLAFDYYTHFTSPIRRYPDMMVHRLLSVYLDKGKSQDKMYYEECCKYSSEREQLATEAERASVKYKLVEFMQDKIGQEFDGTISGLTEWGIYVEIEPTKIEGMIFIKEVREDYLVFDEEKYQTRGKASGRVFNLGDKVRIKVVRANLEQKILDYQLIWNPDSQAADTSGK
ncbi:MAG: ribonuclease R [Bacteroidales bacterium]|nr:ribonuclease R [Bacteroidales bacterium]MDD4670946.1 ribonuclease R [Bacteroidales bacterium]